MFPKKSKTTCTEVQVLQLNCGIVRVQFTTCLPSARPEVVILNLNPLIGISVLLVVRVTVLNHLKCLPVAFSAHREQILINLCRNPNAISTGILAVTKYR